jgi:Cation efflux family
LCTTIPTQALRYRFDGYARVKVSINSVAGITPGHASPELRRVWRKSAAAFEYHLRRRAGKSGRHQSSFPDQGWRRYLLSNSQDRRTLLLVSALQLSYFTIAWNGVAGVSALAAAIIASSPALAAFALNALLDSSASLILVWRFRTERRDPAAAERLERRAHEWIAAAMVVVGVYVGVESLRALVGGSHAEESVFGVILAALSLAVLPLLARRKLLVASALPSGALRGDGILTMAAAALAAITLVALLVNSILDWWWADPAAALVIGAALAIEGVRVAVRHRFG